MGASIRLPAVGIVLGSLAAPERVIGLTGRPCGVPLTDWLDSLSQRGCHLRISPIRSFRGSYVECPGDGSCALSAQGSCPLG